MYNGIVYGNIALHAKLGRGIAHVDVRMLEHSMPIRQVLEPSSPRTRRALEPLSTRTRGMHSHDERYSLARTFLLVYTFHVTCTVVSINERNYPQSCSSTVGMYMYMCTYVIL